MNDKELRQQLSNTLIVRQAHMDFVDAVADFPMTHINTKPSNLDYSFWHLVEHIRICQKDIVDYIVSESYAWGNFPDDYWPDKSADATPTDWQHSIEQFLADRQQLVDIINDPNVDLFHPLPNSGEHQHNILREVQIISAHNAYHTGELGVLRQTLGLW